MTLLRIPGPSFSNTFHPTAPMRYSGIGLRVSVSGHVPGKAKSLYPFLYLRLVKSIRRLLCFYRVYWYFATPVIPRYYRRRCLQPVVCMISDDVDDGRLQTYCPVPAIDDVSKFGLGGLVIHAKGDLLSVGIAQGIMIRSEASRGLQSSRTITTSLVSWDAR